VVDTLCSEEFVDVGVDEVFATLLDDGIYLCSTVHDAPDPEGSWPQWATPPREPWGATSYSSQCSMMNGSRYPADHNDPTGRAEKSSSP
jgi:hypothetical protein